MNDNQFTGYGGTLDEAINAATAAALKAWKPSGPDDMARFHIDSASVLYGGIIGHVGTRVVTVSLMDKMKLLSGADAAGKPELTLKFEVLPQTIYANLMPPVRRPQPHKVGLVLTVTNSGDADFQGQSPNTAIARFSILRGRTTIWHWPQEAGNVVLPVTIRKSESRSFTATWDMADAVEFLNVELNAVALFVPSGQSAVQQIQVKPVF